MWKTCLILTAATEDPSGCFSFSHSLCVCFVVIRYGWRHSWLLSQSFQNDPIGLLHSLSIHTSFTVLHRSMLTACCGVIVFWHAAPKITKKGNLNFVHLLVWHNKDICVLTDMGLFSITTSELWWYWVGGGVEAPFWTCAVCMCVFCTVVSAWV